MQSCSEPGQARAQFGQAIAVQRRPRRSGAFAASASGTAWLAMRRVVAPEGLRRREAGAGKVVFQFACRGRQEAGQCAECLVWGGR